MLMLNKFILKSAPLDLRLPVSSLFVVCLIVPYRNPATPNETLVLMLFMINTQNPGFNPNLISDVVVLVFFNDSSLPLTKRFGEEAEALVFVDSDICPMEQSGREGLAQIAYIAQIELHIVIDVYIQIV